MELSPEQKDAALLEVLEGLDLIEAFHRETIDGEHPLIRDGEVVYDSATGKPVPDPRIARTSERELAEIRRMRDDLLGVDWGDG